MAINLKEIQKDIMVNKEGILIGGIIGYMVAQFLKQNPTLIELSMQTQGLFDNIVGSMNLSNIGEVKLTAIMVITFAFMGYVADKMIKPKK